MRRLREYKFFLNMKKKPPLQEILDRLEDMTLNDIDECEQPLWIKDCLKRYRRENYGPFKEELMAEAYGNTIEHQHIEKNDKHEVREYIGITQFVGRTGTSQIEANPGDLFQIINDNIVQWGTAFVNMDSYQIKNVMTNSISYGEMNAAEYRSAMDKKLKEKYNMKDHEPTPGKFTSADFTHAEDRYAGEVLDSSKSRNIGGSGFPIIIKRH